MILFRISILLAILAGSLPASSQTSLSADSLRSGAQTPYLPMFKLRQGWRFSEGDDRSWASPDFDDSSWLPVNRPFPEKRGVLPADGWTGSGWFRLKIRLAEDVRSHPLAFMISLVGAVELYVDGRHLGSVGTVGQRASEEVATLVTDALPGVIPFDPMEKDEVLVAVRFSNFSGRAHPDIRYYEGFDLGLSELGSSGERLRAVIRDRTVHQVFFGASIGSIALLHLLFYAFHSRVRRNLLFAIYAGCMAVATVLPTEIYVFANDLTTLVFYDPLWKITLVLMVLTGQAFLYDSFNNRPPIYARWALVPLAGLLLGSWWLPLSFYYSTVLISFMELTRTTLAAIRDRREGAVIVGIGFGCLVLSTSHILLVELGVITQFFIHGYLYGFLCLVLSMSIYLARSFARTSSELQDRVAEVESLSERQVEQERTLAEQEREHQEAETRRRILEAENVAKQSEIEASRRRQEMLERLEETTGKIRETQGQLVQSEKMAVLGTLVAGIAHEINTPVGAISSMHDACCARSIG